MSEGRKQFLRVWYVYDGMFDEMIDSRDYDKLERLFYGKTTEPSVLPKKPRQGWLEFNRRLGSLPLLESTFTNRA